MMEENDKLKTLYSTLKNDGYDDIGTEEQFRGAMKDKGKAEKLYSVLKNDGYDDIGEDGNAFYSALNPDHENAEAETAPQPMAQETIPAKVGVQPEPMQVEPVEGFGEGFKQGWKGMKEGMKYFSGEVANLFTGSGEEETRALKRLEEMQASGNVGMLATWSGDGYKGADGKQVYVPAGAEREDLDLIAETVKETGGDIDKAKRILAERAEKEHSWGDEMKASAAEGMKQMRPTKGFGAWVGNLAPQMIPSAAAIVLSVVTKNPKYANMIGGVGMGGMTASTAGQSMMEARQAGASNAQTWAVGITDGVIEFATEKIPFDNYTKRLFNGVKKDTGKKLAEAVTESSSPVRAELERLLTKANKKLGGKLLSGKNAKDYITSIAAEGASEFTAEALQTITPMIYENPEDYPSITEILSNGWEGAKAGLFMGAALGGASKIAEHHEQRSRRKEQGYVDVAQVYLDDNDDLDVVEVVGQDENTGNLQVLHDGRLKEVKRGDVRESHRFSFEEFDKGALDAEVEESYNNGYSLHTAEEMNDAKNMYDYQRERMKSELGVNDEALADGAVDWIGEVQNAMDSGTEEGKKRADTILDYLNAKQVRDGMIQRVRDDIDARVEQSNAMVDARTNRTTGMIQGATMKQNDRRVYVVGGKLVQYEDKSGIDNQASDGSIIVCDAETGKLEQVSPESVFNMDEPLNPLDEKYWAAEAIRQQYAQQEADKMDGKVTFNQGDTYAVTGEDGKVNVTVTANAQGIVDNGDGTVNVSDGTNVFAMSKETIQQAKDAEGMARVVQFEQQRQAGREQAEVKPQLKYNDEVTLTDDNGNVITGNIQEINDDGVLVDVEDSITGMFKPAHFKKEKLEGRLVSVKRDGKALWNRPEEPQVQVEQPQAPTGTGVNTPVQTPVEPQPAVQAAPAAQPKDPGIPAMQRIPKDEQGNPLYEQADSDTAWDAIVEQTDGNEAMAQTVADGMVADKEAALKKLEKTKSKGGNSIAEKIASEKERKAAIDAAKAEFDIWKKIAGTANRRKMDADAERKRIADEAAALRKAEEEKLRAEREEAERIEREALNGVPDMVDDKPQDARARGYRRMNGHKIDRQEPVQALQGKEVSVKFSNDTIVGGRVAVIDANLLQPSHIQGVRNPLHFIDEAQPKERNDEASVMSARKIAGNIRPEEITSSVTAYTGAPTVNARGEVIQGNSRSDALRQMWAGHPEQAGTYKQYLKDHAEEFGLQAEDVEAMEHPVLVNMVDVDDAEAINLGQYVAQDTESGGIERIKPKNIMQKMGNDMRSFANLLLASSDEEISFAGLVDANGANVLKWMMQKGYITSTQYSSAFDSKGNLTAEAKNDLRGIMYQSIFKGGSVRLEEMFNALPVKAQKAILATAFRDYDSPNAERMVEEIQNSIRAYYALSQDKQFTEAKNFKEARIAVESWKHQYQIDDATGESYLPADNFSNFALLLATMYKGEPQGIIQNTFNRIYDLIQGTQEATLFEQPDNTPRTLAQAIYETLNIIYDGQQRSNVLVDNTATSQRGQQGSRGDAQAGERVEDGSRPADGRGGIETDSGLSQRNGTQEAGDIRQPAQMDEETRRESIRLNGEQIDTLLSQMREQAEVDPMVELTPTTWNERFGESGFINTPLGNVKMGENQIAKFFAKGRGKEFGMVAPTLSNPDVIIEKKAPAANAERESKLLFIKTFIKADGSRYVNFESVTVQKDGMEVSISSHEVDEKVVKKEMQNGNILHLRIGLPFSSEWYLTETPIQERPDLVPTSDNNVSKGKLLYRFDGGAQTEQRPADVSVTTSPENLQGISDNKDTNNSVKSSELGEKIAKAEAEVDVNPTDKQKEAGNYKKGHVQVGVFDITIEQPKGSVRSGVDANGNKWETTMQNTYGYIRGTEGVDGDHIDVFLSDDIDGWNGRRVFVVDQYNEDGSFDEHKVMLGFNSQEDAEAAYFANYDKDWAKKHKTVVTPVNLEDFEKWVDSSHRKTKAFAEYKSVKTVEGQNAPQKNTQDNVPCSITPAQYTTKKGKVLDMYLVTLDVDLGETHRKLVNASVKGRKGWWDREKGGYMMRSYEDAELVAEYAMDLHSLPPLSKADLFAVNDGEIVFTEPQQTKPIEKEQTEQAPVWQYSISVDKETGYTTLTRDDVSGPVPIGDGRFRYTADSPEEMLELIRNPKNFSQEVRDAVETSLSNRVEIRKAFREMEEKNKREREAMRTNGVNGFRIGEEVTYKGKKAKIYDFEEYGSHKPVLDTGLAPVVYDVVEWSDIEKVPQAKEGTGEEKKQLDAVEYRGEMYRIGDEVVLNGLRGKVVAINRLKMPVVQTEHATIALKYNGTDELNHHVEPKGNASGNRLVTDERYAELRERMRKKLGGQMNMGIDPEILAIGTEMAVYHLEKGARKFADYAKVMITDLGDAIRPYLKAFYNGARDLPEVAENGLDADMTPYDEVQKFDVANFDKTSIDALATAETITREAEVEQEAEIAQERIKKSRPARKKNEKKAVNSQQSNELGLFDGLTDNNKNSEHGLQRADAELHRQFAITVKADMLAALDNGTKPYRSILDLRKRASELGMEVDNDGRTDILLQELVEDGLVRAAREVVGRKGRDSRASYDLICKLYEMQPTIAARSSNRIKMQQYSTPLPMAWIANRFAMANKADGKVLEPTAGNGMLVFTVPVEQVRANELDETRLDNLREQGFAEVTQQDATEPFEGGMQYDVVIANPPFGKREAVEYDGKMIAGLDPQITLNALASMKDDGRAAIIIGGNMEYASNGAIKNMKPFFTYLYDHYNVKGVIDMSGGLYAKQGTTFPTRMILIDGRRSNEERAQTAVYPPVESKAIRKAESFDDLYEIINEVLNSKEKTNGTEVLRSRERQLASVNNETSGNTDGAGHREQPRKNDDVGSRRKSTQEHSDGGEQVLPRERRTNTADGETRAETPRDNAGGSRSVSDTDIQRVGTERVSTNGVGLKQVPTEHKKRTLTDEKSAYRPHNSAFSLNSVAPAAMVEAMDNVLTQIEAQHGSIDKFIKTELGYDTIDEAHQALAAEQMDSVAMAIYQMKQGQALIIGDQTGVGKGRQMAALIRWAVQRGEKPVFITQKADLFSDIYRDLVDVGSGDLVPFIFNSDGAMVDSKGNTVHKPLSSAEMAKVFASGVLPDEYDFAVLTYSQVNTGDAVSQQEMEEAAKKSGARTKKSKNVKNGKATPKATFLRAIAKDNYLFLDESHTAAGSSNTGAYLQSILRGAKAATFASATFAKRPDTMPLYAIRTAMSQAKVEPNKMISIIEKGGVTLQEIMSRELTNAGQMVRRERDMSDVVTDWKTITDPETVRRARENYDRTIAAFNAIIKFQEDYVKPMIEALDMELAVMAESAGVKRGTDKMGVENVPFASKTYNYTKQLMLALKVDAIADEVEAEINAGRHPVIALESTMESSIKDYAAGETIDEPTFSASLLKGLDSVMQYTVKDEDGNERHERYSPQALDPAGEKAYYELQDFIRESTSDIFISPLDAIIERLNDKGYKVGELTGRNMYVERNDDGRVVVKRRTDKDKKKMQREFNSGVLDVLILNKSASTGISLHASEKFSDQRQRSMIIAQPLSDINDYMQMIGRIDRTGQVHRGYYINLGLPVPAENRFLMMLSTKLKSLNANTTTSQDSESNDVEAPDLLNKYGSQVVVEYLRDNVEIYEKMGAPLKKGGLGGGLVQASELDEYKPQEDDARKITGYVALLTIKEQEEFYDDVVRRYNELIKYLNDTGSNDLKITVMPLRAKTIEKRVSSEGIDPDGNNPFARNSFVEKVEMDVLRKPMKADEIRKVIEQINRGASPAEYLESVIETIRNEDEARIAAEEERYEKAKAKAVEDIAKQTDKINGQKKRSDEEKRVAIENFIAETNEKVENKHNDNIVRLNQSSDQIMRRLRMFEAGKSYLVPDNLEAMVFDFATPAIFCGYKTKDSKITSSTTLAVFATLDGRRRIEIKLSQIDALRSIDKMTNDNWDAARATTLDNWDSQIPSETRKTGFIMTGNILQAIADTQDEYGGYPGQLISYTDTDGNVHDGILMPDKWNASMLKTSGAPLSSRLQQIKDYTPIISHDGKVEIMGSSWAKMFYLTVPKTKKDGAVYYENKTLLRAAGGNFYPYRGKLRADIPADHIDEVVKELTKLGVKVKDDTTDILQRNGIGAYTDDEVSYENDPVAKLLGQSRRTAKQRREFAQRERQRMAERVESLAEKLHLDNVEVVTDASVLDGKKQRAKGFYSKSTGKITIVIPNHTSTFDVEQTLLHEAVAHYGLRQLFGEHFDTFLDNVFNNAEESIRRRIVDMAAKNGWDFRKATEEYLASLAEDTEFENINANWWRQIKDFFLNMLHKIGFEDFRGVTLTDNELRYILWRSYENLKEPGRYRSILGEAADVAKQYELKVGNYAVDNQKNSRAADDTLFRDGDPEIHERVLARDRYEMRVKSGMFQSQEALQDSMLGLKEAMTAILGKRTNVEDVDGFENAYLGENRLSSVNKAEADAFAHTLFKPMLDEVAKLSRTEAEREELTDYMMAKHGLERNIYMRNEAINNGATDADQTDYAGLTALTGMDNVADAEAEAQLMIDDYEQAHDTTNLWEKVNAVSKAILSKSYECGMMSKSTFDKISNMYDFYIPLRGFDEKTSSEAYAYLTHKQSAFNAPIKKAEGRRSKADDPFSNLQSMAEGAIMQGNRNKLVKQRFLNFTLNHPSDLVSVSDIWVEYDTVSDEWKPVFPDNIDSTNTSEEVERKMLDFETKMESLAQQYPDRYKHGKDTVNIPYRIVESRDMRQHQIVVKRGGRDYVITINGNPRAAQALNGQTNPDNDMSGAIGAILRAGENINRQLSAFYTTRNPDFIVSNFMRDMLYTNTMTWIRESPNYALRFHRNYMYANPVWIKQLLAKHRKGTLDMGNKTEAMFHQFMMNGGETGYANIRDIEQHKNDIRRELKKSNGKIPVKKAWDLLGERFDEYNRAVENSARFAAFMTSREMGRSIDRAIYDAKEISVNFNKKGSGAKFYDSTGQTKTGNASALVSGLGRSGYVFWNAAIQGTANFGRQMKRHPAKAFTGIAAMFLLGAIVAYLGGDDDDDDDKNAYYNLPEYVRRSNILFRAGDSWVSIPLPVEYKAVYGMGELMISVLNGKEHLTDGEIAEAIAGQATQILPIDFLEGGGGLNAFVPSAYKPLWEAYVAEKSWTGMPLYKNIPWNKDMPEWTKAYKSANKYIVGLANVMNEATGGDPYTKGAIDLNPAKIEYMLNGYFGGVFGTVDELSKTAETIAGDREYDPRSILLVNRLVKAGDERTEYRAVNNEYFRLKEEHDRLKSRLKHYEEDTDNGIFDYAEKIDFLYNSPEYLRYEIFEEYQGEIDALYDELKITVDGEERKVIEAELNSVKEEMIEKINQSRKQ